MRLDITTTKGVPGVTGTVVSREGKRLYRAHYADVETALYKGVLFGLTSHRGVWEVAIDGVELETGDVVERLKAYLDRFPDGVVVGVGRDDTTSDDLIERMVVMLEDGGRDEFSDY